MATTQKTKKKALIIGAGPSGLVTAKYLLHEAPQTFGSSYEVTILEASNNHGIGGTFVNKVYDGTRLVSSKYITSFSDFRFDLEVIKDHPTTEEYVEYLQRYCDKFDINDKIKYNCRVVSLQDFNIDNKNKSKNKNKNKLEKKNDDDDDLDSNGYLVKYETTITNTNNTNTDNQQQQQQQQQVNTTKIIKEEHYDIVAVCSGLHNVPYLPQSIIDLQSTFDGEIIHSSNYKDSNVFNNKRVLILGSGETAMDIAFRAINNPSCKNVALNVRRGFLSIPHNLAKGRPLDVFITNLFEHSYEHPWIHYLQLRWILSTWIIRLFLFLTGSSVGFNQWSCETTPIKRGYHIINKSHDAMAHLNVPIKKYGIFWGKFWLWVYGETNLRPIESYHKTSVVGIVGGDDGTGSKKSKTILFDDGRTYDADIIVLATGYKQSFPFLCESIKDEHRRRQQQQQQKSHHHYHTTSSSCCNGGTEKTNKKTTTSSSNGTMAELSSSSSSPFSLKEDYLPSQHFITSPNRPRLGFIGFVRPNVGAIPPMSELQVMWWLCRMNGKVDMFDNGNDNKNKPRSYMVLGQKYPYGVDYGNYMHRVAEDVGCAPTLSTLAMSKSPIKALFTYCFGQSYISLFRLEGIFASQQCWDIFLNELYDVCIDRGWIENFGLIAVCWISLWMNLAACIIEVVWCLLTLKQPQFFVRYG